MLINKKFNVLDKGWIELVGVLGDDLSIVEAARTSTSASNPAEPNLSGEGRESSSETVDEQMLRDKKLLRYLFVNKHTSPFEQVIFKFRVRAPVVVWWQWVRHRTWSYNAQSGRYAELSEEFYVPESWRGQAETNKQGSIEGIYTDAENADISKKFSRFTEYAYELYQEALSSGIAREQARLFLPAFSSYYTFVCTVNAHNLMHFLRLRLDDDAQWEIREYARTIYEEVFREILPWTAELFEESL